MSKMTLKTMPCIKDQAYFIMVGVGGSWLVDATYPSNQDETWCKNFVNKFIGDYGNEVNTKWGVCLQNAAIQQHIDDSYEDILQYRLQKLIKA